MGTLKTFSKVDVNKMDLSEYDDPVEEKPNRMGKLGGAAGMLQNHLGGGEDMDEMMNNLGNGMGGQDFDEYKITAVEPNDVGKTFDVTQGKQQAMKKIIAAGQNFENPRKPWEVEICYSGSLEDGTVFDGEFATTPRIVPVGSGLLVAGLERALRTFRLGEHATVTIQPDMAFGEEGDEEKGVPANAVVIYDLKLIKMFEVSQVTEGVRKKIIDKTTNWESPKDLCEVTVRWSAELLDSGVMIVDNAQYQYTHGDMNILGFWNHIGMRVDEVAEFIIEPQLAYGETGSESLGVPPNAKIKATVTLEGFVQVDDISPDRDGKALKAIIEKGTGWDKPRDLYELAIDLKVKKAGDAGELLNKEDLLYIVNGDDGSGQLLDGACGGALINDALKLMLKTMAMGEVAELRCKQSFLQTSEDMVIEAALKSWVKVEPVPGTGEQVIRKMVFEPEKEYNRPNEEATCTVIFFVRLVEAPDDVFETSGDEPLVFVQGREQVLRCIDAAVREMKKGEKAIISAPAEWAYGAPFCTFGKDKAGASGSAVQVELELVDFVRAKEQYEMDAAEKIDAQTLKKEQGNMMFKRQKYSEAIRKYEKANALAPSDADVDKMVVPDEEKAEKKAIVKKAKCACFVNLAVCHLRLEDAAAALTASNSALEIDSQSVKALFRRAQAYMISLELEAARADLIAAAKLDPKSRDIRQELETLKKVQAEARLNEKRSYGGMFK